MRIVARVPGQDPWLVKVCVEIGLRVKRVQGGLIVDLPLTRRRKEPLVYQIPRLFPRDMTLLVEEEEAGCAGLYAGSATTVAGMSGARMKPFCTLHRTGEPTRILFGAPEGLLVARATWHGEEGGPVFAHVKEVTVRRADDRAHLRAPVVWRGKAHEAPQRYQDMVMAAAARARCRNCQHTHYGR